MEGNNGQTPESYKEKKRRKAKEKRKKEQMSFTLAGIIIYSVILVLVIAGSYIGFKTFFNNYTEKKALEEQMLEQERLEEEKRLAEQEEEQRRLQEEEDRKKAEEEANAAAEGQFTDTVFSVIENVKDPKNALVNTFNFTRKQIYSSEEKLLDYCVYTNPENNQVEKITTREDCGDLFEITDYYYNNGVVNYIAQYKEDVDIPIDISGTGVESRCYFNNNKMVRYIYCENDIATEYRKVDFPSYSDGTKEQYEYIEDMMLELSENAFKNAASMDEEVLVTGFVLDEYNQVLKDNYVALIDYNGNVAYETTTNGDGYYEFTVPADDDAEYMLRAGRDTLIETDVYGIRPVNGSKVIYVDTIYLCYEQNGMSYPVQIFVKDADDFNTPLSGAQIRLRYGINNTSGESFMTGNLGMAGECAPQIRSGNYTAEIEKEGYETCYTSFTIKPDRQAVIMYAAKDLVDDEYKCILSYDTTPLDLDLRAYDSYGRTLYKSVNDSVGAATAEVLDIKNAGTDVYPVFVSNFADIAAMDNFSYRLSKSGAKLYIYNADGWVGTYPVPEAHAGILWKPVEIRNGKILATNDFYTNVAEHSAFREK